MADVSLFLSEIRLFGLFEKVGTVVSGRIAGLFFEQTGEVIGILEAESRRDVKDLVGGVDQHGLGGFDFQVQEKLMQRNIDFAFKFFLQRGHGDIMRQGNIFYVYFGARNIVAHFFFDNMVQF